MAPGLEVVPCLLSAKCHHDARVWHGSLWLWKQGDQPCWRRER